MEGIRKIQFNHKKEKGIIILALEQNLYARFAHNLACSLRQPGNGLYKHQIDVCLIADKARIDELGSHKRLFDKIIELKPEESTNPFFAKLQLYDLSPYEETLYIDADTLRLPDTDIPSLFTELSAQEFICANRGWINQGTTGYDWCDPKELLKVTDVDQMLHVSSEFMYFKKTEKVRQIFTDANTFYLTNKIVNKPIATYQPDEPALAYGIAKSGLNIQPVPYFPMFWETHYNGTAWKPNQIHAHKFLSMGGSLLSDKSRKKYDGLLKHYSTQAGTVYYPYPVRGKGDIKSRQLL